MRAIVDFPYQLNHFAKRYAAHFVHQPTYVSRKEYRRGCSQARKYMLSGVRIKEYVDNAQ